METKEKPKEKPELVSPKYRESKLEPQDVQLVDGRPLYHALLPNPEALVISPNEEREARQRLSRLIGAAPDKVLACQGKTLVEARKFLKSIETELRG